VIPVSPALRLLARRKFVGFWRRQARRMRTPKGALLALLGLAVFALWFGGVLVQSLGNQRALLDPNVLELTVVASLFALTLLSLANALSFRGLYVHPSEIETLFSAPIPRSEMIRFRLLSNLGRTLFGALFLAAVMAPRAPRPWFGALGAAMAMLTLPVIAQGVSILAGSAENRLARKLSKLPLRRITVLLVIAVIVGLMQIGPFEFDGSRREWLERAAQHPAVRLLRIPYLPWIRAIEARELSVFLPWFGACASIFVVLFELVARIDVDFRELSLETSADVAKRLARARRGLGAAGMEAGKATRRWRIPWIFGRGPVGAVAWRKLAGVVRKATTSVAVGAVIVAAVTLFAVQISDRETAWAPQLVVAGFGTFYLTLGLRSDFREDLEAMASIKSWPIAPWKLFVATLLPEVVLVTLLVEAGIATVTAYGGSLDPLIGLVAGAVPLVVMTWVSIDNAVFLVAPVRFVPGHDSALQNAGRGILLMALRSAVLLVVVLSAAMPALACRLLFETSARTTLAVGGTAGLVLLAAEIAVLVRLGGLALSRFDIAADRG
jgi:hypothetical protein